MTTPLHILFAEDSPDDAQLIMLQLEQAGLEADYQRVDNEADFITALAATPDLILSDYAMPQFNGLRALGILKESGLDIPFLLISGTVGEDIAVDAIKQGADDYLMKDRLARLGSSVRNALEQKRLREEKARADKALRESERQLKESQSIAGLGTYVLDLATGLWKSSQVLDKILGIDVEYPRTEGTWVQLIHPDDRQAVLDYLMNDVIARHARFDREFRTVRHNDHAERWAHVVGALEFDSQGQPVSLLGTVLDITERKQANEALRESQQAYQSLINTVDGIVWEADANTFEYHFVSQRAERLLGYPIERWTNEPTFWKDHIHPDDRGWAVNYCIARTREMRSHEFEYRMIAADERIVWLRDIVSVIVENDQPVKLRGIMVDVTARKQAEEKLRISEERYRGIFQTAAVSISEEDFSKVQAALDELRAQGVTDFRGYIMEHPDFARRAAQMVKVLDVNDASLKMYGVKDKAELLGGLEKFVEPEMFQEELIAFAEGETYFEKETADRRLDGSLINFWMTTTFFTDATGVRKALVCLIDITERKQAEEKLRESESDLNTAQTIAKLGGWRVELNTGLGLRSAEMFRLYGRDPALGPPLYLDFLEYVHPADRQALIQNETQAIAERRSFYNEYRVLDSSGGVRWFAARGEPQYDQAGNPLCIFGTTQDITERKQAEEKIQRQNQRLKVLREIDTAILAADSVENIVRAALDHIRELIECQRASLALIDLGANEAAAFDVRTIGETSLPQGLRFPLAQFQDMIQTLSKNQPVLINDLNALADPPPQIQSLIKDGLRSLCTLPLFSQGTLIGAFSLSSDIPGFFDEEKNSLGREVANQVAIAITQSRLSEETNQRLENLQTLNRVSTALRTAQTKDEMLPILLDETLAILKAQDGSIWLYDAANDQLKQATARGWPRQFSHITMRSGEGLHGRVFASGQPHLSHEIADDPWLVEEARPLIPRGWNQVSVPIQTADEAIGTLLIAVKQPREIQAGEVNLLTTIAEMAGNAIHRTSLRESTERRLRNLQSLHEMERAISSSFDARLTLNMLLDRAITRLGVDAAAVLLFDPATYTLEYAAGRGFQNQGIEKSRVRLGEGAAGSAAQERRVVVLPDLNSDASDFTRNGLILGEGFVAYHCAPLVAKGQVKGALETYHRVPFTADSEWIDFLETLAAQAAVAIDNAELFENIQRSNLNLARAYDATIEGWSRALDLRDKETEGHTQRVTELTERLAHALSISDGDLVHIRRGALLHDIGKMGIPDNILLKPDKLTEKEWESMRRHPVYAFEMLSPIEYLRPALDIPYCHHEKWDGAGYPRGLKGEAIPFAARIFAAADVWDAVTSNRPYRKGWSKEEARAYIQSESGKHFDPKVVEYFLKLINDEI